MGVERAEHPVEEGEDPVDVQEGVDSELRGWTGYLTRHLQGGAVAEASVLLGIFYMYSHGCTHCTPRRVVSVPSLTNFS